MSQIQTGDSSSVHKSQQLSGTTPASPLVSRYPAADLLFAVFSTGGGSCRHQDPAEARSTNPYQCGLDHTCRLLIQSIVGVIANEQNMRSPPLACMQGFSISTDLDTMGARAMWGDERTGRSVR